MTTVATIEDKHALAAGGDVVPSLEEITIVGGQYDSVCTPDGKYAILNVEVFSEHEKGENGVDYALTREWLKEAFDLLKQAETERGYYVPVNVGHNGDEGKPPPYRVGYFRASKLEEIEYGGKKRLTLFGDIIGLESPDFDRIRRFDLPYRSLEIVSLKNRIIGPVALLSNEVPYFQYPLLSVGSVEVQADQYVAGAPISLPSYEATPMLAYRASGDHVLLLYRYGGQTMSGTKEEIKKDVVPPVVPAPEADKAKFAAEDKKDEKKEEPKKDESKMAADDTADETVIGYVKKIWDAVQKLVSPDKEKNAAETEKKDDGAKDDKAPAQDTKYSAKQEIDADAKYAAKSMEAEAATTKLTAKEREEKALADLKGIGIGKDVREKIAKYAAQGDEPLKDFVDTFKKYARKDPPASVEGGTVITADIPEAVLKYKAKTPAEFELRAKQYGEFQEHQKLGGSIKSFERFVEVEDLRAQAAL